MRVLIVEYLPWLLSLITICHSWLVGNKSLNGWRLSMVGQALWSVWVVASATWGLVPLNLALWFIYVRNFRKWKHEAKATEEAQGQDADSDFVDARFASFQETLQEDRRKRS